MLVSKSHVENIEGSGRSGTIEFHDHCVKIELDSVPGYLSCGPTKAMALAHALSGEPERYMGYLKQVGESGRMALKVLG